MQEKRLDLRRRSRLPGRSRRSACAAEHAAGLADVLGATPEQLENAAEIGLEHNLGLTCDPDGGAIPSAVHRAQRHRRRQAINATQMALRGDGKHFISLDRVIRTMRDTGADMHDKYKETSRGGRIQNRLRRLIYVVLG